MLDYITSAIATLLVVSDPIFMSALFLGLTSDMTAEQRKEVAARGATIAFCILLVAGLGGAKLLDLLGISLSAFRIAGGLLLLSAAAEMVFDRRSQRQQEIAKTAITIDHVRNIAAFPLAIPLMAGPGAITAMILLAGRAEGDYGKLGALYGVAALVMVACYLCFRIAVPISKTLGITGRAVISRLLGIILAALAVQFVIDGVLTISR
jgi:multiple antibiotic resistance protein